MPKEFVFLCVTLLITIGIIFIFIGWFLFCFMRLDPERAEKTTGRLICFRKHLSTTQFSVNYTDYRENGPGRVPVFMFGIGGRQVEVSAASADYSLKTEDIGKQIKILYQRRFGLVVLADNDKTVHNYVQLKRILFGSFLCVGIILIVIGCIILLLTRGLI